MRHLPEIPIYSYVGSRKVKRYGRCGRLGVRVGERLIHYSNQNIKLPVISIKIFLSSMKNVGATAFGSFWALGWDRRTDRRKWLDRLG